MWSSNKSKTRETQKKEKLNNLLDSTCEFYSNELEQVKNDVSLKNSQISNATSEVENRHILIEKLREEIEVRTKDSQDLEILLVDEEARKDLITIENDKAQEVLIKVNSKHNELLEKLEMYKEVVLETNDELSEKRERISKNEEEIARLSEQSELLELKTSASKLIKKQVEQDFEQVKNLIKIERDLSKKLAEEVSIIDRELPDLTKKLNVCQSDLDQVLNEISEKKLSLLKAKSDNEESVESIKKISENVTLREVELTKLKGTLKLEQDNLVSLKNEIVLKNETLNRLNSEKGETLNLLDSIEKDTLTKTEVRNNLKVTISKTEESVKKSQVTLKVFEKSIGEVSFEVELLEKRLEDKKNIAEKTKKDIDNKQKLVKDYLVKVCDLNETLNSNLFSMKDMVAHDPKLSEKVIGLFAQMTSIEETVKLSSNVAHEFLNKVENGHKSQSEIFDEKSKVLLDGLEHLTNVQERVVEIKEDKLKKEELLCSINRRIDKRLISVKDLEDKLVCLKDEFKGIDQDIIEKDDLLLSLDSKIESLQEREASLLEELNIQKQIFNTDQENQASIKSSFDKKQEHVISLENELSDIKVKRKNNTDRMALINSKIDMVDRSILSLGEKQLTMQSDLDEILSQEEEQKLLLSKKEVDLSKVESKVSLIKKVIEDKTKTNALLELSELDEVKSRFEKKFFNVDLSIKRTNKFVLDENSMAKINLIEKTIGHFLSKVEGEFGYDIEAESVIELKSRSGNASVNFSGFKKLSTLKARNYFSEQANEIMKDHKKDGLKLKFKTKTTLLKDVSSLEVIVSIDWIERVLEVSTR